MYRQKGFTLIELLIVIGVISILAGGLLILIDPGKQLAKARDAQRKADLHEIQNALEEYYNDHGQYPVACNDDAASPSRHSMTGDNWFPQLNPYIKKMPKDPKNIANYPNSSTSFYYEYQSKKIGTVTNKNTPFPCDTTGQYYELGTHLETPGDPSINWDFTEFWHGWMVNYVVTN